jgi:hypothetical protein
LLKSLAAVVPEVGWAADSHYGTSCSAETAAQPKPAFPLSRLLQTISRDTKNESNRDKTASLEHSILKLYGGTANGTCDGS